MYWILTISPPISNSLSSISRAEGWPSLNKAFRILANININILDTYHQSTDFQTSLLHLQGRVLAVLR